MEENAIESSDDGSWVDEMESDGVDENCESSEEGGEDSKIWRNDIRELASDEQLQVSPGCYDMLHALQLDWPCLSFDILLDQFGACRTNYPHLSYLVCGTQPRELENCSLYVLKCTGLDRSENDESTEMEIPKMEHRVSRHPGIVNRIRACPQAKHLVCTMSDNGRAYIWDIHKQLESVDEGSAIISDKLNPVFVNELHGGVEGYAVGWNRKSTGIIATGDVSGTLILWNPVQGGWNLSKVYEGVHKKAVEDIQWQNDQIFATASADGKIRVFDLKCSNSTPPAVYLSRETANDVNSISWNPHKSEMLLSGDEDGNAFVWDIRSPRDPLASLIWHKRAITSVSWHPTEQGVCACASRDDSISIWDLSVEAIDTIESRPASDKLQELPEQLMFLHMGQTDITEVSYHPLIPGMLVSTASDGFNIFKCSNAQRKARAAIISMARNVLDVN